jgi:xylan 1,4-beta-xylosidase
MRTEIANVGHADLVEASDGATWAVLLATWTHDGVDSLLGRQTHVVPVAWDEGRPLFAPGDGRVRAEVEVSGMPDQAERPASRRDDFARLGREWNGVRRLPASFADAEGGRLRLRAGATASDGFLGQRLPASRTDTRVTVERGDAGRAGLLLRTSDAAQVEVSVSADGHVRAVVRTEGEEILVGTLRSTETSSVRLRLQIDGFTATAWADDERLGTFDVAGLSTSHVGGFTGCWIGPFAAGGGTAEFTEFELTEL